MRVNLEKQQGFTLLELLLVLALITISISLPLLAFGSSIEAVRLENTANLLKSQLRLIQEQALAEGQYYEIRFDLSLNRYRVYRGSEKIRTIKFPSGIHYSYVSTGGDAAFPLLRFYPTGSPSSGASVALETSYHSKLYVIITPAVGRVRISQQPALQ